MLISKQWCLQACPGYVPHHQLIFFHYGKVPELFRNSSGTKTKKTEKLFFSREIQEEILHMDSVFQFFSFSVLVRELFRNICGKTEKLFFPERSRKRFSIWIQFFSFSVLVRELFRNICGKTEKLFFQRDPGRDSPYGFSFSVFQFWFGNYSEIFAEKLKNCFFPERSRKRFSIWIQFFSLLHHRAGTTVELFFESLFITCHLFCIYHLYMVPPQKKLPKSRGQNVRETL